MDVFLSSQMGLLTVLVLMLFIGEVISIKTKAWIPSVFVTAVLFLLAYWTFLPKDAVAKAGIPVATATMMMALLVANMGTLLSVKELMRQWKIIVIALGGIAGITVALLYGAVHLLDWNTVVVATPPLVGGIVSAIIMSNGAKELGLTDLSVLAILIYVIQGFAGYPLTSVMLKKEGNRILNKYRKGEIIKTDETVDPTNVDDSTPARMFQNMPSVFNTAYFKFFRLAFMAALAFLASAGFKALGVNVNAFVLCLLFGIIGKSIGFLETHNLKSAGGFGFALLALMLFIFDTLKQATPEMVVNLMYPLLVIIVIGVIGMYIFSAIIGRMVGVSKEMAFSASLTALYGFPADYVITMEVITSLTKDEDERAVLTHHMLPPMLVAGFITVTIVSVILAGIMVNWIKV